MRSLTALLCLTFAVLLFSAGEAWSLPKCTGSVVSSWHNCFGTYTWSYGAEYVGEWRNGKRHGQGTYTWPDGEVREGVWKNGAFQYAREDPKVAEREQRQKQAMQAIRETCNEFGFKEGSESFAQCMLDLFKLEQGAIQSQAAPNAASDGAAAAASDGAAAAASERAAAAALQNALLEQQQRQLDEMRRQREIDEGIALMGLGLGMAFPPPKPTTTCRWNEIMQTMTCN